MTLTAHRTQPRAEKNTMTTEAKPPQDDTRPALAQFVVPSYAPDHPNKKFVVLKWLVVLVLTMVVVALVMGVWGHARWVKHTHEHVLALEAATPKTRPERYDDAELVSLPPVVRRYLTAVLNPNQPIVRGVYMEQTGTFNRSMQTEQWARFTAKQRVATKRPGFVWDASISVAPGISVRVSDAYVAGVGSLQPSVFGLIDLGGSQGNSDVARGELIRYFAESVWYPTALLPSQGVQWKPVDAQTAIATLTDGPLTVSLRFTFNAQGLVERIHSDERSAVVDGAPVPMAWEVQLSDYKTHSGMLVPQRAEAAWLTPTGHMPYWRGKIDKVDYDMPRF